MKKGTGHVLTIVALYVVLGSLLYRQRVVSAAEVWNSDSLVFILPAVLTFLALCFALWPEVVQGSAPRTLWSRARALGLAGIVTAVSFCAYACLVFSVYGT